MQYTRTHLRLMIFITAIIAATSWYVITNRFVASAQDSAQASVSETPITPMATNGRIAFERTINGTPKIFTANADGSGERCLMCADANDSRIGELPAYSPDGQTIAFVRLGEIWLMNADGSNQRRLATPAEGFSPAWSPDGARLVFSRSSQFGIDVWIMNADGSSQVQLTKDELDESPAWGATNRIAFERTVFDNAAHRDIFIMDAADANGDGTGDNLANITNNPANDRKPAWSPDASRIAFHSDRNTFPKSDIYTMTAQGADVQRLTNVNYDDQDPIYSPDGAQIAFESGSRPEASSNRIFVMNTDGSLQRPLTTSTTQERNPAWQPVNTSTEPTTADLAITLTDSPDPIIEQQDVTYKITVTNNGAASSRGNLRVTLLMEDFVSLRGVFVTASAGCNDGGDGTIFCRSDETLVNGASVSFDVTVRYRPGRGTGKADATASITRADRDDTTLANNSATAETTIKKAASPANDDFNNAQIISTASSCTTGTNVGATEESPFRGISGQREKSHAGRSAMRSVWYKWTAPDYDANVSFDTGGSGFNTILAVYAIRTDFPDALTDIASNDDSFNRGTSYVYFRAERGRAYYIAVTGSERASGAIGLCHVVSRQVIPAPVPQRIDAIAPAFINLDATSGDLILQITGSGFTSDSRVLVNSQECFRPNASAPCETNTGIQTTVRSATNLEARIPAQFIRSPGALIINVLTGSSLTDATALRILPLVVVTVPPQTTASGNVTAPDGTSLNSTVTNNTSNPINVTNAVYDSSLLPQPPPPGVGLGGTGFGVHLLGQDGAGIVSNDCCTVQSTLTSGLIGQDPAGVIGQDAAGIMVLAKSGNELLGQDGAGIISGGAGNFGAAGIISGGAGNVIGGGISNILSKSFRNMLSAKEPIIKPTADTSNTGWYVVRSANGAMPTINVNQVNADGDFTVTASMNFDATSFPRISDMASTVFVLVANPAIVQFSAVTAIVSESARTATVTITRTGDTSQFVTVNYSTANGTAVAGNDYATTSGTLTFAANETSKTFTVPVFTDRVNEPDETFIINLSAPTNAALANRQLQVTITNTQVRTRNFRRFRRR